jgi:hypothetical protein
MKTYGGVDVQSHLLLTSAPVGGEWSASRSYCFIPREIGAGICWIGGWVGNQGSSGRRGEEKNLARTGTQTTTPRPSSLYPAYIPTDLSRLPLMCNREQKAKVIDKR